MDNYISIIFKFQLAIGTELSKIDNLRLFDYFGYHIDSSFFPYSKPEKEKLDSLTEEEKFILSMGSELSEERQSEIRSINKKYDIDLKKWESDCIKDSKFRNELKTTIYNRIQEYYEKIINTKKEVKSKVGYNYLTNYSTYTKHTIDSWLKIWPEVVLKEESLENLLIFNKHRQSCLDKEVVRKNEKILSDERRKTEDFFRQEASNYTNNSYEEGGGGDEWSDSSSYW